MPRQPSGLIGSANSREASTLRSAIASNSLTFARLTMCRSHTVKLLSLLRSICAARRGSLSNVICCGQVYGKVGDVSITLQVIWVRCVSDGGFKGGLVGARNWLVSLVH